MSARVHRVLGLVRDFISSNLLNRLTLATYSLMAIAFALKVPFSKFRGMTGGVPIVPDGGIAPDEFRHIGNVLYYAQLDLLNGPVIQTATEVSLRLGEITRFPSYLYYYFLSFFVRWFDFTPELYSQAVLTMRLVTAVFGLLTLIVVAKTLRRLQFSPAVVNLSVLALVMTGRFTWMSAAVSYDIPSMFLFVLFCHFAVRLIQERNASWFIALAALTFLNAEVKYTYLPFQAFFGLVIAIWFISQKRKGTTASKWPPSKLSIGLWFAGLAISFALFAERIMQNFLVYKKLEPACDQIQSYEACYRYFGIFRRNASAAKHVLEGTVAPLDNPLTYSAKWAYNMYQSLFFYRGWGTSEWSLATHVVIIGMLAVVVATMAFWFGAISRNLSAERQFAIFASVAYCLGVFAFNAKTYVNLHQTYAASGRYLMPIFGFFFAFMFVGLQKLYQIVPLRKVTVGAFSVLAVLFVWWHNPILAYEQLFNHEQVWANTGVLGELLSALTNGRAR